MKSFLIGFLSVRQKRARGGLGFTATMAFLALAFLLAAATAGSATTAAARAVAHPALIGLSPSPEGLIDGLVVLRCCDSDGWREGRGLPPPPGGTYSPPLGVKLGR